MNTMRGTSFWSGWNMSLVKKVAPACAWVAENADHVKIRAEKIPEYAGFILSKYPVTTEMGAEDHYICDNSEEEAAYVLALDSINFGSGTFHIARECGIEFEYAVIAGGLKKAFERGKLNMPEKWVKATAADFSRLLSVPQGRHPELDRLLEAFAAHLREAGQKIIAEYEGRVLKLVTASGYSAPKLADIVAEWKGFHDVHQYKGREIPILKRAQIFASDINLTLGGMKDIGKLTIFADNMVPHVLRCDGILEYSASLAAKIDGGAPLLSGSAEEVEIRSSAIHAVELMKQAAGGRVTSVNLDHMLWHRGYEPDLYKRPTHRTLTTDY
jgi:hypothetical protein